MGVLSDAALASVLAEIGGEGAGGLSSVYPAGGDPFAHTPRMNYGAAPANGRWGGVGGLLTGGAARARAYGTAQGQLEGATVQERMAAAEKAKNEALIAASRQHWRDASTSGMADADVPMNLKLALMDNDPNPEAYQKSNTEVNKQGFLSQAADAASKGDLGAMNNYLALAHGEPMTTNEVQGTYNLNPHGAPGVASLGATGMTLADIGEKGAQAADANARVGLINAQTGLANWRQQKLLDAVAKNPAIAAKIKGAQDTLSATLYAAQGDPVKEAQAQAQYNAQVDQFANPQQGPTLADSPLGGIINAAKQVFGLGNAAQPAAQPSQSSGRQDGMLPPQAAAQLKEGTRTTFGNGQTWTLVNGQPQQVK